jgi:transposase
MMVWTAPNGINVPDWFGDDSHQTKEPSVTKISMIGLDIAKNVFQVHGVDASGQVVLRRQLRRGQVEKFFAKLEPCVVGLEACGGAHHWARVLQRLGHEVRLMSARYVKAYVKRNKTDGRDAEGVCEAMQRPSMRLVPVKSVDQQGILVLHRTRHLLSRQRTMAGNALRGALAEFGIVAAPGVKGLRELVAGLAEAPIPEAARAALSLLAVQWENLDSAVAKLEGQIVRALRDDETARRLIEVPCIGPISASAILAKVPDPHAFRSARDFAAWMGLTPRQFGTAGKQRSGGISKQGDRTLRTLLVLGATSYLRQARARGVMDPWLRAILARRPSKVAARGQNGADHLGNAGKRRALSLARGGCRLRRSRDLVLSTSMCM